MSKFLRRSINYLFKYPRHFSLYSSFGFFFVTAAYSFKDSTNETIRLGFAGSFAQLLTEMTIHPIDTINTRTKFEILAKLNALDMARFIAREEGPIGFIRGASATYYGALIGGIIYFYSYKNIKTHLQRLETLSGNFWFLTFSVSSFISQGLFTIFYYPFDLIRTRMQTRVMAYRYTSMLDAYSSIMGGLSLRSLRHFKRLYQGAAPAFVMNMSNSTIMFTTNELLRQMFVKRNNLKSVHEMDTSTYLTCSAFSGFLSGACTNSLEVITIHKQVGGSNFHLVNFIRKEGLRPFYSGIFARSLISSYQCITLFFAVDAFGTFFNVDL